MHGVFRPFPIVAAIIASASLPALAQVQNVAPYFAVPTADRTPIHCADGDRFYRVGELSTAMVVVVDAEGGGWSRIQYPAGLSAFVRAVDISVQGNTGTLTAPSRLRARNIASGYDGSYKSLFDTPLPAGTTLRVQEEVKDAAGSIAAYRVEAPPGAHGFVPSRQLRRATDAEVAAFRARATLPDLPAAPAGTPSTAPTPSPTPAPAPAPTTPTPDATQPAPAPTPGQPSTEITQRTDPTAEPIVPPPAPTPAPRPETRPVGTVERLDATFQRVWSQPVLESEIDELIVEFDRAIEQTPAERAGQRRQLEGRREALLIRREFRDRLRRQEEARALLDSDRVRLTEQLREIERTRYYTIVGQLQPSLVYDGRQLPQMYRIVSVGATAPRTLGYLRASTQFDLDSMLGQVVGVIGEAQIDRSLQLNIITPVTVDTLRAAPSDSSR
jgi:hypothetical protein